jgi:hypothetical protein
MGNGALAGGPEVFGATIDSSGFGWWTGLNFLFMITLCFNKPDFSLKPPQMPMTASSLAVG